MTFELIEKMWTEKEPLIGASCHFGFLGLYEMFTAGFPAKITSDVRHVLSSLLSTLSSLLSPLSSLLSTLSSFLSPLLPPLSSLLSSLFFPLPSLLSPLLSPLSSPLSPLSSPLSSFLSPLDALSCYLTVSLLYHSVYDICMCMHVYAHVYCRW